MPEFNGIIKNLEIDEILRYAGLKKGESFPSDLVEKAIREIKFLAEPRGIYQEYAYDEASHTIVAENFQFTGKNIVKHLEGCNSVCVLAVTVGEDVEERIAELFKNKEYTMALLLDAAATTAVESLADQLDEFISNNMRKKGYLTTWRFSPGYGDWALEVQADLLNIAKADKIGLIATETHMLMPRKSVTAVKGVFGCSENVEKRHISKCARCAHKNCEFRRL